MKIEKYLTLGENYVFCTYNKRVYTNINNNILIIINNNILILTIIYSY